MKHTEDYIDGTYVDGQEIPVRHIVTPNVASRMVLFEKRGGEAGIRVDKHWFSWDHFFEVNFIVK